MDLPDYILESCPIAAVVSTLGAGGKPSSIKISLDRDVIRLLDGFDDIRAKVETMFDDVVMVTGDDRGMTITPKADFEALRDVAVFLGLRVFLALNRGDPGLQPLRERHSEGRKVVRERVLAALGKSYPSARITSDDATVSATFFDADNCRLNDDMSDQLAAVIERFSTDGLEEAESVLLPDGTGAVLFSAKWKNLDRLDPVLVAFHADYRNILRRAIKCVEGELSELNSLLTGRDA